MPGRHLESLDDREKMLGCGERGILVRSTIRIKVAISRSGQKNVTPAPPRGQGRNRRKAADYLPASLFLLVRAVSVGAFCPYLKGVLRKSKEKFLHHGEKGGSTFFASY